MPVDVVGDVDVIGSGVEGDVLDEGGVLPVARDVDGLAERAVADDVDRVDVIDDGRGFIESAGVDVPGVVFLWGVDEGLELVAAGVGRQVLVGVCRIADLGDAAGLRDRWTLSACRWRESGRRARFRSHAAAWLTRSGCVQNRIAESWYVNCCEYGVIAIVESLL